MTDSPRQSEPAAAPARELAARVGEFAVRAWRAARTWRRARPFWAGLLLIVAGAELLMIPLPTHAMGLIVHIGTGGVLGILIGAVLIVTGLLLWFHSSQRVFYSIVAVLVAVAALIASNLGGFLIGTLLGVIGGSLGFAWAPLQPGEPSSHRRPRGTAVHSVAVLPIIAVLASLLGLGTPGAPGADPASSPSASPSPSCTPSLLTLLKPCPSASPTPGASASPSPSPAASPSPARTPRPSASSRAAAAAASPAPAASPSPRNGTAPGYAIAASPSTLSAASADITGFRYLGTVPVHTAAGRVTMMQFSMTSLALTGVTLTTRQGGGVITTKAPSLDLTGHVVLYATSLSGDLLGVPVTITPGSPIADILQALAPLTQQVPVSMTNVVTQQPFTSADDMAVSGLAIS